MKVLNYVIEPFHAGDVSVLPMDVCIEEPGRVSVATVLIANRSGPGLSAVRQTAPGAQRG